MSRRLEFGRRRVLKEGGDAYSADRAFARRLRGNRRRVASPMLLLGLIGAAGIVWLSLSELPHMRRVSQWAAPKQPAPPLAPPAEPEVVAGPSIPQTPVPVPEAKISPDALEPVAAAEGPTATAGSGALSPDELQSLMGLASTLIVQADVAAARLVLERAASSGDTRAIFALAETYDPNMLSAWRVRGIKGDRNRANALYRQALAKGQAEARSRIVALRSE
jgi:hypothetical protein